jgi:hypothetical protein
MICVMKSNILILVIYLIRFVYNYFNSFMIENFFLYLEIYWKTCIFIFFTKKINYITCCEAKLYWNIYCLCMYGVIKTVNDVTRSHHQLRPMAPGCFCQSWQKNYRAHIIIVLANGGLVKWPTFQSPLDSCSGWPLQHALLRYSFFTLSLVHIATPTNFSKPHLTITEVVWLVFILIIFFNF